jgi:hypothetical protein
VGVDHRLAARNAPDADVEEAPYAEADGETGEKPEAQEFGRKAAEMVDWQGFSDRFA